MRYLRNLRWEMVLFSLASIIIGLLMLFYPGKVVTAASIVIACIFFVMGIRYLIEYRRRDALGDFYRYELVMGIIMIAAGIVVLIFMDSILSIITYAIAIIVIVSGFMKVENAFDLKKMRRTWVPLLVFAILCIVMGIMVLIMPMNHNDDGTVTAGDFMVQCAGIILAISGLIDFITTLAVSGKIKVWTVDRNAGIADSDINEYDDEYTEVVYEDEYDDSDEYEEVYMESEEDDK